MDRKVPAAVQPEFDARERAAHVRAQMGTQLRRMYAEVVGGGVPARFVELLRGLDTPDLEEGSNQ
jgi:Anti-sigma factor NepR